MSLRMAAKKRKPNGTTPLRSYIERDQLQLGSYDPGVGSALLFNKGSTVFPFHAFGNYASQLSTEVSWFSRT